VEISTDREKFFVELKRNSYDSYTEDKVDVSVVGENRRAALLKAKDKFKEKKLGFISVDDRCSNDCPVQQSIKLQKR
jgi:hypothetical protein